MYLVVLSDGSELFDSVFVVAVDSGVLGVVNFDVVEVAIVA